MLGAAPTQAPNPDAAAEKSPPLRLSKWLGVVSLGALTLIVLVPTGAGAIAHGVSAERAKSSPLPRLWGIQVSGDPGGWFDRTLVKQVRKDGVNALVVKISTLGRTAAGDRRFDAVRSFASAEHLYLVAVVPAGKPHTPAAKHAIAACSSGRFTRLRCAVQARSTVAAARLARERDAVRQLVAVYVAGPRRVLGLAGLAKSLRRRILVVAPLSRRFDAQAWGAAIGQTAALPFVNLAVSPQPPQVSSAVRQVSTMLSTSASIASAGGSKGHGKALPAMPTGLSTSQVEQKSITLSWSPDRTSVAGYRLSLNGTQVATSGTTSYLYSGLSCGTSYTLGVAAYDSSGAVSGTATTSQSTDPCPDTTPPSTPTGLSTSSVTQSSVTLSWSASTDDVGVAGYRLFLNGLQVGTSTSTSFAFGGLSCGTSYTLGVAAYDAAGNLSSTATTGTATSGCPDTQAPSMPGGLGTSSVGRTSMTLSWVASSDNIGVAGYRLFRNGTQVGTSTSTSYAFSGLTCGTSYTLGVAAYDAAGNVSGTATTSHATSACADTQAPSTPSGLATSSVAPTSIALSWTASTDNVGVVGYRLFSNGTQVGTSTSTGYSFTGLTCGTSYTLGVAAYDAAGNVSTTATVSQSTSACSGDTQPPTTPTGLATSAVGQTSVTLSWTASTDNVGVSGYRLFLNGSQVGTSTSTSYPFAGLGCATSYTLGVAAYDAAGNVSSTATVTQVTSACPPPATPTNLAVGAIGQTSMTLSWASSGIGVAGYRLFLGGTQVGTSTTTSYSFTGLSCGTSYTLGVAAFDSAGDASSTATTTSSTAACSSGGGVTANIFVSAAGSNTGANCKRYSPAQADPGGTVCATFAKACSLAQGGDQILVRNDGNYSEQTLTYSDCPNASASAPITFVGESSSAIPAVGAAPDAPDLNASCTYDCYGVTLEAEGTYTNGPNYVTLRNFRVNAYVTAGGNQTASSGPGTHGVGLVVDHVSAGAVYSFGTTNITVENSDFGNCYQEGTHPCMAAQSSDFSNTGSGTSRQAESGVYRHNWWHDYNANNSDTDHGECFFALDWTGSLTFDGNRFWNCVVSGGMRLERIVNPPGGSLLTIENNWFGTMYDHTPYSSGQRCEDITWGSNSGSLSNILIRYNTFGAGGGPFGSSGSPTSTFRIIGNLVGQDPTTDTCENGSPADANYGNAVVDHNVWVGGDEGTNSAHVASVSAFNALLTNPAGDSTMDYHLAGTTSLPNNFVPCTSGDAQLTWDFDGDPRPHDSPNCDAGADEH